MRQAVFIVSPTYLWSFRVGLPSLTQEVVSRCNEANFYTKQGGFARQPESICLQEAGTAGKSHRKTAIYISQFKRTPMKLLADTTCGFSPTHLPPKLIKNMQRLPLQVNFPIHFYGFQP